MISARTVKDVVAGLSKSIADDPAYADELVAIDMWDRANFSQYAGYEFTNAAWQDFVDFCAHEPIDWTDWFETWCKHWVEPSQPNAPGEELDKADHELAIEITEEIYRQFKDKPVSTMTMMQVSVSVMATVAGTVHDPEAALQHMITNARRFIAEGRSEADAPREEP